MTDYVPPDNRQEIREIIRAMFYPLVFVVLLWLIYGISEYFSFDTAVLGIQPLQLKGLIGILTAPLVHADTDHILGNSSALVVLGFGLCFFYRRKALHIFLFIYIFSGLWGWLLARRGCHIGASGLVYGLYFFLTVSAFIKREKRTIAFALLSTFLYGSIVWGFFPELFPGKNISWEIHITGMVAGILSAFYFRKEGPQRPVIPDDEEDDEEDDDYCLNSD
jgi:membrane associated rhomboid family serine protease